MAQPPFDDLAAAYEYVSLLLAAVRETQGDVATDLAAGDGGARWREALQLVAYKLDRLGQQLESSRRLMNDLRRLRRLLVEEGVDASTPRPAAPPRAVDGGDDPWHDT
jgi:hypothetical protein